MRYRILGIVAALCSGLFVASPAHAEGEVTLTMAGGVFYDSCGHHDFVTTVIPGYSFSLKVSLIAPDGTEAASGTVYEYKPSGAPVTDQVFICQDPNLVGTYQLTATGEACVSSMSCTPVTAVPLAVNFRLPQTDTSLKVRSKQSAKGSKVKFVARLRDERPEGFFETAYGEVYLEARHNGNWRRIAKQTTNSLGKATFAVRLKQRKLKVRAVTLPTSTRTGSRSEAITVRAR